MLAPIILLVYNRPHHTRKILESLKANDLADKSTLFIYADGPKLNSTPENINKIQETRKVLREKQWCQEVYIKELNENLGVDESTIRHVTEIINEYGKVIVLEDDIETSKGFLNFINDALDLYEDEEKVMNISGYMYPVKKELPSSVMLKGYTCNWGWGTWKRAWNHFNPDYKFLASKISASPESVKEFNIENSYNYLKMLQECTEVHKPWDICWYASVFLKGGFCIWPGNSLVQNIGHDASGEHCGITNKFTVETLTEYAPVKKLPLVTNEFARKAIKEFLKSLYYWSLYKKLKSYLEFPLSGFFKRIQG